MINRIAAGEIIVAPANALKELLENALDAGASKVDATVKEGGLKLLQITDDGAGIHKDDLPLLCQRFATSKITQFEDLESIATYGFRGEALASISHISHLSVITKTADSTCAWRATYSDGELREVKPTAGTQGTQIIVEDLFYNVPARLRSIKGGSEEFSKIVDVVGRYAIHSDHGFAVKKFGDSHFTLSTRPKLAIKERVRSVFGTGVAQELVAFTLDGVEKYGVLKVEGQITNPNYNSKKAIAPVFFINNRLISHDRLRRALNSTVQHFLPKGHKPFIYVSLMIDPTHLDVNVHPTKKEVRFLHEDEIIDEICFKVREELLLIDSSRAFPTQSLLPQVQKHDEDSAIPPPQSAKKTRLDYKYVRTDSSQSKITNYLSQSQSQPVPSQLGHHSLTADITEEPGATFTAMTTAFPNTSGEPIYKRMDKPRVDVNLQSIMDLRAQVEIQSNEKLAELFTNFTYIGIVDSAKRLCAVQNGVKLLLVDYGALLYEAFYQIGLQDFQNFGVIKVNVDMRNLIHDVVVNGAEVVSVDRCLENLTSMGEMLDEYFGIKIQGENLQNLPLLAKGYIPSLAKLPLFLYKLGAKVEWDDEEKCLEGILRQISLLYTPLMIEEHGETEEATEVQQQLKLSLNETMENVLMPLVRRRFLAPKSLKPYVVEIANLPGLYRVFERC